MAQMKRPSRVSISVGNYAVDYETSDMNFIDLRKLALEDMCKMAHNRNPLYDEEDDGTDDEPDTSSGKVKGCESVKKKVEVEFMKCYA